MLSVICFSKDRPLQIEAYIQSLLFYADLPSRSISVLYADSPATSYQALIEKYPDVNWRREKNFRTDLLDLLQGSEDYVLLGCDDVFFTDRFDYREALGTLAGDRNIFGFSLRLGLNLRPLPELTLTDGVIKWDWRTYVGHWNYPWDVSGSIYRRDFVARYVEATPGVTKPNPFEFLLADSARQLPFGMGTHLACFARSKCLTLTVNRVQDEFPNEFDQSQATDVDSLYKAHESGWYLDWPKFYRAQNRIIHVDSGFFKLTRHIEPPIVVGSGQAREDLGRRMDGFRLQLHMQYWKYLTKTRATAKSLVPHKVRQELRKFMAR